MGEDDINVMKGGHLHMTINLANCPKTLKNLIKRGYKRSQMSGKFKAKKPSFKYANSKGGKLKLKFRFKGKKGKKAKKGKKTLKFKFKKGKKSSKKGGLKLKFKFKGGKKAKN